jgi:alpha-glucosidase
MSEQPQVWWQQGVIYQVYPRSFQDSDGDGVGDLRGVLARLDYLVSLGVDAVWVSPFYPSPMADFGYDVSDYTGVDPLFGTMADFDALLAGAHERGLKLILDFVPNHTSDRHPWFIESRASRTSAKRDWYLWHAAGPDGAAPNNWLSNFGGSAWTLNEPTGDYYLHSFLKQQPDLNWRNPAVRAAMYAAMRFWLDKGVDGFRMDVLWLLIKDDQFRDNTSWGERNADQPETLEIVHEMRRLMETYSGERLLIGEIYLPIAQLIKYYGSPLLLDGAQMPFNFRLIQTAWQAEAVASLIEEYEAALPSGTWPNWVLGNHDQSRLATRLGPSQARLAAMLLLTLRGTPTLYYGDELGLPDARIAAADVVDPAEKNQPGQGHGRDPERSPMPWQNDENAGFAPVGVKTWLPLVWDWPQFTVETQEADPRTMLKLYRRLLALRRERVELHAGSIEAVAARDGVLSYIRRSGWQRLEIVLNMTNEPRPAECTPGRVLVSTSLDREGWVPGLVELRPNEGFVLELELEPADPGAV